MPFFYQIILFSFFLSFISYNVKIYCLKSVDVYSIQSDLLNMYLHIYKAYIYIYCILCFTLLTLHLFMPDDANRINTSCLLNSARGVGEGDVVWCLPFQFFDTFPLKFLYCLTFCKIKCYFNAKSTLFCMTSELGTLEWWISGLMLNPLFLLISRLT